MARVVKVDLLLDVVKYLRPAREAKRETKGVGGALDDAAKSATKASTALDATAKEMSDAARAAAALDRRVDELRGSLRGLAVQSALSGGSVDLDKQVRAQQSALRKALNARKLLGDAGEDAASGFAASFVARLGPLVARAPMAGMNPAALAIAAPLAAGAATLVGTAIAGAIVGGVGIGGVVGGLKIAAQDAQVKKAGTALGADVGAMLQRAAAPMVPAALGAIETLRQEALGLEPDLRRVFGAAARYVAPLTRGLTDAAENAMPGIIEAMEHAGPVIDAVAEGMRDIGSAVGDSLSDLSQYADEGARALNLLFNTVEVGISATSDLIEGFAMLYGWSEKLAALWSGGVPELAGLVAEERNAEAASRGLAGGLGGVGGAARDAAENAGDLIDALQTLNGLTLNANDAERNFQQAIDDAREAFDKKVTTIDKGTERGRKYSKSLDEIAVSAYDSAQAIYDQTGSVEAANGKINEGRNALYRQARQYGLTEAKAWEYVDSVLAIPKRWNTKVNLEAQAALRDAKALRSVLQSLKNRNITIGVRWQTNGDLKVPGGTQLKDRWGGVHTPVAMAAGGIMQAGVYRASSPPLIQFAEPQTGGEAFIPRFGNRDRSLDILATAARWYGMQVGPMARAAAPAAAAPQFTLAQLTAAVRAGNAGLTVQMDGRTVGVVQGRQADIYSRGA